MEWGNIMCVAPKQRHQPSEHNIDICDTKKENCCVAHLSGIFEKFSRFNFFLQKKKKKNILGYKIWVLFQPFKKKKKKNTQKKNNNNPPNLNIGAFPTAKFVIYK